MGGSLTYYQKQKFKTEGESEMAKAGFFPSCKGFFPDCPDEPSLMNSMCRTCPKTDGIKKPKMEE